MIVSSQYSDPTAGIDEIGDGERRERQPAVLADRKDRLVGGVAGLELADLAVDHRLIPAR